MPEISDAIKTLIVKGHAEYLSPNEIIGAVKTLHGVQVSNQQVYAYSPNSPKCADKWKNLHHELRDRFLKNVSDIPIANTAFQLLALQDAYRRLTSNPAYINETEVLNTLVTAAKLVGGMYSTPR
jgi:hypothetical protein